MSLKILHGIDLVKVKRMEQAALKKGKTFLDRVFTPAERAYCSSKRMRWEHYAARWAAKEAVLKALKVKIKKGERLRDIEIKRQASGKPYVFLSDPVCKRWHIPKKTRFEISLAHEREYAIATVVAIIP